MKRNKIVNEKKMRWKDLTKIAISGSRKFEEPDLAAAYIDRYIRRNFESIEDVVLLTGGAPGVDDAIERYCIRRGVMNFVFYARWNELAPPYGKNPAGVIRNQHIIDLAQEFFAFWDGNSPGTRDAINRAKAKGIPIKILQVERVRRILKIKPPSKLIVPNGVSPSLVRRIIRKDSISNLIKAADITALLKEKRKKIKKFPQLRIPSL
jgi:hypothetical protein